MSIKAYILEGPYNAMFHPDMKAVVAAWDAPEPGFDPQRAGEQREHPKHKRATAGKLAMIPAVTGGIITFT